jgi:hypothetical protein
MAQYAEIVEIVAPASAAPGQRVDAVVRIKNKYSAPIGIMAVGVPEYPGSPSGEYITGLAPHEAWVNTNAGWVAEFTGHFIMPSTSVTIHIYSYYFGGEFWHLDDEKTKVVNLSALAPAFSDFTITDYLKV